MSHPSKFPLKGNISISIVPLSLPCFPRHNVFMIVSFLYLRRFSVVVRFEHKDKTVKKDTNGKIYDIPRYSIIECGYGKLISSFCLLGSNTNASNLILLRSLFLSKVVPLQKIICILPKDYQNSK